METIVSTTKISTSNLAHVKYKLKFIHKLHVVAQYTSLRYINFHRSAQQCHLVRGNPCFSRTANTWRQGSFIVVANLQRHKSLVTVQVLHIIAASHKSIICIFSG